MTIEVKEDLVNNIYGRVRYYFEEISKIPRGSGNEGAIADFLVGFANKFIEYPMLESKLDCKRSSEIINGKQTHNVLIFKPASGESYKSLPTVIMQAHIDMVCQKIQGSEHNFERDSIKIKIDEETGMMTTENKETTLGVDDGIGVACILAILERNDIPHPPIQALFTSDEEDGMTGAMAVTEDFLGGIKCKRLINIDTETEGIMYNGCAGGIDANFCLPITHEPIPQGFSFVEIKLSGLHGGHSGVEIHKKYANAHKLMARVLRAVQDDYRMCLVTFSGGDKRNVITKEAGALIAVEKDNADNVIDLIGNQKDIFVHEYKGIETFIELTAKTVSSDKKRALSQESMNKFINAILVIPNDVQAMHGNNVEGLVETSCNLGIIRQEPQQIYFCSLIRSFFRTKKLYVLEQMRSLAKLIGACFSFSGDYPDWEPNLESELNVRFNHAYKTAFPDCGENFPKVESIHAGLECGYFSERFPGMDMIACGPTITGAHTPEETLYLESTKKVIKLLLTVLAQMNEEPPKTTCCAEAKAAHEKETGHTHVCQCIR